MPLDEEEIAEYYDDLQASGGGGTILRPMHGHARRDPTIRWGDTLPLIFRDVPAAVGGFALDTVTGQFMRVGLPAPRVCSLAFHATLLSKIPAALPFIVVDFIALELAIGVGSSTFTRRVAFARLPEPNVPLDVVVADVPLANLAVTASARLKSGVAVNGNEVTIVLTGQLTPVVPV